MSSNNNKKVIYYVLGVTALATGMYFLSNKDEVKRYLDYLKGLVKRKKIEEQEEKDIK